MNTSTTTTDSELQVDTVRPGVEASLEGRFPTDDFADGLAKDLGRRVVANLGIAVRALLGRRRGEHFGILLYHRIAPRLPGVPAPTYNVEPDRFEEHITGLCRRSFHPWSLNRAVQWVRRGEPLPPRTFIITFDDVFASVYHYAYPVLRRLGVPAAGFLSTHYLNQRGPFPFDAWGLRYADRVPEEMYLPLSLEQCREMQEEGVFEWGTHTHTHQDFRGCPATLREDLQASSRCLCEALGVKASLPFAYPFGAGPHGFHSHELESIVRNEGVLCGLTADAHCNGSDNDPMRWGRYVVYPWDSSATLAAKLDGWCDWAAELYRAVRYRKRLPSKAEQSQP